MYDNSEIKDWVANELNQFQEKFETIEDMKHEQEHLKLQCNFHSNNIDDIQFQIQNQLKILRETDGYKDTQKQISRLEQNIQQKDEGFNQMSERIKEMAKKMSDIKRQSEMGSSNSNQLEERKIWKKLEDKL